MTFTFAVLGARFTRSYMNVVRDCRGRGHYYSPAGLKLPSNLLQPITETWSQSWAPTQYHVRE